MKAIINSAELEKELKFISPAIRKNSVIPITSAVKMEFTKGNVKVTGTDLETTAIFFLKCECKNVFDVVITYQEILDVCSKMYSVPITIELKEDKIVISDEKATLKFSKAGNENEFPLTTDDELSLTVDVDGDFFYALSNANTFKSKDELAVKMNMSCLDFKNKTGVSVVGTNANFLYLKKIDSKPNKDKIIMVPDSFVQITKTFQDSTIWASDNWIKAESGNKTVIARLGEQKFVNYGAIMPTDPICNFTANVKDLKRTLNIAGVTSDKTTGMCNLSFKENELIVSAINIDYNKEGECKVDAKHSVDFENVFINGNDMLHVLNQITSDKVEMCFTAPTKTIFIKPVSDDSITCLLQPLFNKN